MKQSPHTGLIAVDGGGTSCRFALQTPGGRVVVRKGSANVYSAPEAAIETLRAGLSDLAREVGLSIDGIGNFPAYAGLAGVVDADRGAEVAAQLPLRHLKVEDDRPSAVAGALGGRTGAVIGCGTGSFLARQAGGRIVLAGGHGFQVGDEASAAWLGRQLLRRSLHVLDGVLPETAATQKVLTGFDGRASAISRFAQTAQPADYGRYAPVVTEAASQGDPVASGIMAEGAAYIRDTLRALGHMPGETVCMVGSVAPHYTGYLPEAITAGLTAPLGEPLDGAMLLAQRFADEIQMGST